jgi:hypothetical protein
MEIYNNIPKESFILWLLNVADKENKELEYIKFFKTFYFLEKDLQEKEFSTGYNFLDHHFGAFDTELKRDIRALDNFGVLEIKAAPWKNSLMLSHTIKISDLGRDYVKRVSERELREILGTEEIKQLYIKAKEYMEKNDQELIDDSLKDWIRAHPQDEGIIKKIFSYSQRDKDLTAIC